jgi:acyl-CoA synthetase (AMP-forming)/AMP-acid ligase II
VTATSVSARLRQAAEIAPDAPFVIDDAVHTFGDVEARVQETARALGGVGVGDGTSVHLQLANSLEFVVCFIAINRLGAVAVPTSPASTVDDVAYVASHAECAVSIVDADTAAVVIAAREMAPEIHHVLTVGDAPDVGDVPSIDSLRRSSRDTVAESSPDGGRLAAVLYTSGTTAWPKGVMLTNRNLLFAGETVSSFLRMRPDDRWLVTLPLFHLNALGYSLMSALATGASVAMQRQFDPATWPADLQRFGATLSSTFAVHARRLLAVAPPTAPTQLRVFLFSQHLTTAERTALESRFGAPAVQWYGMTETIAPTIADSLYGERRAEEIGTVLPWASVKLIDHGGHTQPPGRPGELVVRGEPGRTLMAGYFKRPDETNLVMRDGWLRTGDRMVEGVDGSFRFLGRAAEVIKPGVDNVSAPEIERVLYEHVSVLDASVVGATNESGDEEIVAFIVLQPGDDATPAELLAWAAERLADHKVPQRVILVDELPRNQIGKVLRRELQRRLSP